jgi:hypothetical protein
MNADINFEMAYNEIYRENEEKSFDNQEIMIKESSKCKTSIIQPD